MRSGKLSVGSAALLGILTVGGFVVGMRASAQTEAVLHSFGRGVDGAQPQSGLIIDAAGNLYGTTSLGGAYGYGMVFELSPLGDEGWNERVLHSFTNSFNGEADGAYPDGGLTFDAAGSLYGTTAEGGPSGGGTVFELTPAEDGNWTERILHNFNNGTVADGNTPASALVFDSAGNLYGTTVYGGRSGSGTAFELTPTADGSWTEKVLHSFDSSGRDGQFPQSALILDGAGNLYGATLSGGGGNDGGDGTMFEIMPTASGWEEKTIYNFDANFGEGGSNPAGSPVFDAAGNLYVAMALGGKGRCNPAGCGTVVELTPGGGGSWTEQVLYYFDGSDGSSPAGGLIFDAAGHLYGATSYGGRHPYGAVFELSRAADGSWTEQVLHSFNLNGKDGVFPNGGLILDAAGSIYGTTNEGGPYANSFPYGGTVFKITP